MLSDVIFSKKFPETFAMSVSPWLKADEFFVKSICAAEIKEDDKIKRIEKRVVNSKVGVNLLNFKLKLFLLFLTLKKSMLVVILRMVSPSSIKKKEVNKVYFSGEMLVVVWSFPKQNRKNYWEAEFSEKLILPQPKKHSRQSNNKKKNTKQTRSCSSQTRNSMSC